MPSVCLRLNNFRKCQQKSEKCIKILTTFMWTPLLPPCTSQEGLGIWQKDWPLCQEWKCSESLYEISQNPKLAEGSDLLPSCQVQGPGESLIPPTRVVLLPGLMLLSWGPRMFFIIVIENGKKILTSSGILRPICATYCLYFICHCSLFIHVAKEELFYYLHYL